MKYYSDTLDQFEFDGLQKNKRIICPYDDCTYSSVRLSNFRLHIRHHTGERPFPCSFKGCHYRATQQSNLTAHLRIHSGNRPFKCPKDGCVYSALRFQHISAHISKFHSETRGGEIRKSIRLNVPPDAEVAELLLQIKKIRNMA